MAAVIRRRMAGGRYVSNHLVSRAIDIRTKYLSLNEQRILREVSAAKGATKVLYEGVPSHLHVPF